MGKKGGKKSAKTGALTRMELTEILKEFMKHVDKRFDDVDKRFDEIDKRFDRLEFRLDNERRETETLKDDMRVVKTKLNL